MRLSRQVVIHTPQYVGDDDNDHDRDGDGDRGSSSSSKQQLVPSSPSNASATPAQAREFGSLLLQAQEDLERVTKLLHSLPPIDADQKTRQKYQDLQQSIQKTASRLRKKAETVLESDVEAHQEEKTVRVSGLPDVFSPRGPVAVGKRTRKSRLATKIPEAQPVPIQGRTPRKKQGGKKQRQRPINRYGPQGKLRKSSSRKHNTVLPRRYRQDPMAMPERDYAVSEQQKVGMLSLINRGEVLKDRDLTETIVSGEAPCLVQQPAKLHHYYDQFEQGSIVTAMDNTVPLGVKYDVVEDKNYNNSLARKKKNNNDQLQSKSGNRGALVIQSAVVDGYTSGVVKANASRTVTVQRGHRDGDGDEDDYGGDYSDQEDKVAIATTKYDFFNNDDGQLIVAGTEDLEYDQDKRRGDIEVREYDQLLDEYSAHHLMIRKGKVIDSTPEYISFRRTYSPMWGPIQRILKQLEKLLVGCRVPLAYAQGQKVVELARNELNTPTVMALVGCITGVDRGQLLARLPGLRYSGVEGRDRAACKIQATWRSFSARKQYLAHLHAHYSATAIQRIWRSYCALKATRTKLANMWGTKLATWRETMRKFMEDWPRIKAKKRVVIHVPSLTWGEQRRQQMHNFSIRQNTQMARLTDLKDPNVQVVYICPFTLPADVHAYYMKLMEIARLTDVESRFKIMVPEASKTFSTHSSLASLCLLSPKMLEEIKAFVRGRPAYIVPGDVGDEDLRLAVNLNIPILSAEPHVASVFSTKSGSKRVFAAAKVPTPMGVHDLYDKDDLYTSFAKLIVDHMYVRRWIFKADHECGGRGIAYFEPACLDVYHSLRRDRETSLVDWKDHTNPHAVNVREDYYIKVERELRTILPKEIVICNALLHPSWNAYCKTFFEVGGVIEACPNSVVSSPVVNILIQPNGKVNVLSTHDQVFVAPYTCGGALFPSSTHFGTLCNAANAVGKACFAHDVIGYASIDFLVYLDDSTPNAPPQYRMWAVDLKLQMTNFSCSYKLFDFLMGGEFHKSKVDGGHYTVTMKSRASNRRGSNSNNSNSNNGISAALESKTNEKRRYYVVLDYAFHPTVSSLQFGAFFNLCRLNGISFDLRGRSGTAFIIVDSLAGGSVGALCVGHSPLKALENMNKCLDFLKLHADSKGLAKENANSTFQFATEFKLQDIQTAFRTARDAFKRLEQQRKQQQNQ